MQIVLPLDARGLVVGLTTNSVVEPLERATSIYRMRPQPQVRLTLRCLPERSRLINTTANHRPPSRSSACCQGDNASVCQQHLWEWLTTREKGWSSQTIFIRIKLRTNLGMGDNTDTLPSVRQGKITLSSFRFFARRFPQTREIWTSVMEKKCSLRFWRKRIRKLGALTQYILTCSYI